MIIRFFFAFTLRVKAVLPCCLNAAQSLTWRGLAAGRPAKAGAMKRKYNKRRIGLGAGTQAIDASMVTRSLPGGAQRWCRYPLSKPHGRKRRIQSWLRLEKWEGVRGRVAP